MAGQHIDRDKLRAAIRRMGSEYVFYMLDDAVALCCLAPAAFAITCPSAIPKCSTRVPEGASTAIYLLGAGLTCFGDGALAADRQGREFGAGGTEPAPPL
jgi:hypothetical protein